MTRQAPAYHGRDHLPGHADPIPGIALLTDLVGGNLDWAVFFGTALDNIAPDRQGLIFDDGIFRQQGTGFTLGASDRRIECTTGSYLIFCTANVTPIGSTNQTVVLEGTSYYDSTGGGTWTTGFGAFQQYFHAYRQDGDFTNALGQARLMNFAFYDFAGAGSFAGGVTFEYVQTDTVNPAALGGHQAFVLRLS